MLYPFKFNPILKPVLWGGEKICDYKSLPAQTENIGESWEISAIPGNISTVAQGPLQNQSLNDLIETYGEKLLGKNVTDRFGLVFPLLFKFIDAKQDLSIQVHPNDHLAKTRHDSFGKTEMWYVVNADKDAFLYSGFSKEITPEQYTKSLEDDSFPEYLQKYTIEAGDVFFLPAGQVHAIGAGCFVAEIQQSSDITYRIYDYNRKDNSGNRRELHTDLAKDAINYQVYPEDKIHYCPEKEVQSLVQSTHFTTNLIAGKSGRIIHLTHQDTFIVYICITGEIQLTDNKGNSINMTQGDTVLIPAENGHLVTIEVKRDCKLLETYL